MSACSEGGMSQEWRGSGRDPHSATAQLINNNENMAERRPTLRKIIYKTKFYSNLANIKMSNIDEQTSETKQLLKD
ncbi:hypothetical protein E2C01_009512 [Portunus trituberculatus]|uniref:Uncharacterized protein n=1 Tax=Portunus trituberculatus TaxID=210409 RepID=A0A5B7D5Y7_PORTR|nr:hypothetical protein [Portunus trituberculatus]